MKDINWFCDVMGFELQLWQKLWLALTHPRAMSVIREWRKAVQKQQKINDWSK